MSYNGLLDPLGPSQILPYVERLHARWPLHMLSFERRAALARPGALPAMQERLRKQGLAWTWRRYHKWPSLPATAWDVLTGIVTLRRILRRQNVRLIHARGYLPAAIAVASSRRHPILFDIRGLQAEEYVDGGLWKEGELKHRLVKRVEDEAFRRAAGAVVLTHAIAPYAAARLGAGGRPVPLEIIPCCVDLTTFDFQPLERARQRARLGVPEEAALFVYSGSLGTWYLPEEMARFVRVFRETTGRPSHLLWLVNNAPELARQASRQAGLADSEITVLGASAAEVPAYLSAADAAVALIRPCFSKLSSSPTKYAEALAVGIPLLIHRDVGDGTELVEREGAVALDYPVTADGLLGAARHLSRLMAKPRTHFRALAHELFDVDSVAMPAYRRLYEQLCLP